MASSKPHVVMFPFMAQGHTFPIIDLSKALSRRNVRVTIITTPSNAPSIEPHVSEYPHVRIRTIPFPSNVVPGLPEGCEGMSGLKTDAQALAFLNATKLLRQPFEAAMRELMKEDNGVGAPKCVISDSFLGWTNGVCRELGLKRVVFNGMGVFATLVKKSLAVHKGHESALTDHDRVEVKGVDLSFDITRSDLPLSLRVSDGEIAKFFLEAERNDLGSWGVMVNTFEELENGYVSPLENLYGKNYDGSFTKAFCVGPLFLYDQIEGDCGLGLGLGPKKGDEPWVPWLDRHVGGKKEKLVIYVSFGSMAELCDEQLDELAHGLEHSGEKYMWIVRSKSWKNPIKTARGLILREWVDQKRVLAHRAVGGFLSHCGWNSTLESVANGVPVLTWPMHAEQHLNAKYLVDGLKVGISLEGGSAREGKVVGRDAISKGVKELMSGTRGKKARERAIRFDKIAKMAVQVGGSSYNGLNDFIELIQ